MENSDSGQGSLGDQATLSGLTTALATILPALERFMQFDEPEQTGAQRAIWSSRLDEPLPLRFAHAISILVQRWLM